MKRWRYVLVSIVLVLSVLGSGCSGDSKGKVKLNPDNPVTITVWHYYNSAIMEAFEEKVKLFNETIGAEEGIIVETNAMGDVAELEKTVISSANQEVGSAAMPNIFASYADTAYEAEKMDILADLDLYLSEEEKGEYLDSYIEEGRIGLNGELRIFPIAKSTEVMMLNETDWVPFAEENDLTYDDLSTLEGLTRVAKLYYEWTDNKTPNKKNDGKAFYGRDSLANYFISASKEFDTEIFRVSQGKGTANIRDDIMRKIWDNYYVPFISGYFTAYGRYRSDDAKVGDIIAYIGSTTSARYFPAEVTANGETYDVTAKVLPAPHFEDGTSVMIQQGAGMVVVKSTQEEEYACTVFLKWFTEETNNIDFSARSGYMPVKKSAINYDTFMTEVNNSGQTLDPITDETIKIAFEQMSTGTLYTNKAFEGGVNARSILENNLQDKAVADRKTVKKQLDRGVLLEDAVAEFNTDKEFDRWLTLFKEKLEETME